MKQIVVGLIMNTAETRILLVKKKAPVQIENRWSGLHGEMKETETPISAMMRIYNSQNIWRVTSENQWRHFCTFFGTDYDVHFVVGRVILASFTEGIYEQVQTREPMKTALVEHLISRENPISSIALPEGFRMLLLMAIYREVKFCSVDLNGYYAGLGQWQPVDATAPQPLPDVPFPNNYDTPNPTIDLIRLEPEPRGDMADSSPFSVSDGVQVRNGDSEIIQELDIRRNMPRRRPSRHAPESPYSDAVQRTATLVVNMFEDEVGNSSNNMFKVQRAGMAYTPESRAWSKTLQRVKEAALEVLVRGPLPTSPTASQWREAFAYILNDSRVNNSLMLKRNILEYDFTLF